MTRKNSNLPPFKANTCPYMMKRGKDGMYVSQDNEKGIMIWRKIIV
jgi:hypothetical protein